MMFAFGLKGRAREVIRGAAHALFLGDYIDNMIAVGNCADNVAAEGFFSMIKRECVRRDFTLAEARSDIFDYIERFHTPRVQRRIEARDQAFTVLTQLSAKTVYNLLDLTTTAEKRDDRSTFQG